MGKKFLSALISLSMVMGLLPQFTIIARAAGPVSYDPLTTDYAILNRYNCDDQNYYTSYVKNTDNYNAVSRFGLAVGETYTNLKSYLYSCSLNNYEALASTGQLKVNLSATLKNVAKKHGGFFTGGYYTSISYQYAALGFGNRRQDITGYDFIADGDSTQREGDRNYTSVGSGGTSSMALSVNMRHTYEDCNSDGGCSISDIVVAFADTKSPTVQGVYSCDADGNADSIFKTGDDAYLKVAFSEPIRFADNNAADHSGITATMQDSNADKLTGSLVALKDNYLLFRFDDTSLSGFLSKNITLTQVDLSSLFGSFSLVQVKNGAPISIGTYSGAGYTASTSLITDIAGNPLTISSSNNAAALTSACYIDGENPYVASISKTAQMNNGDVKTALGKTDPTAHDYSDASDTHAGVGDSIIYTANFNEKLNIDGKCCDSNSITEMVATLNVKEKVKDKDGNDIYSYVKIRAESAAQVSGGVDCNNGASQGMITAVTFSPFTLEEGMTCDDGEIKVTSITPSSGDVSITDLAGNSYSCNDSSNKWDTLNSDPLLMDVIPPGTATTITQNEDGTYTPVPVTKSGNTVTEFYFPVTITDDSGTDSLTGSFTWTNDASTSTDESFQYEYAATATSDEPQPDQWQAGTTGQAFSFTQVSSGNDIHIRLINDEQYDLLSTSLSVTAVDYAGNSCTTSYLLDYSADNVAPTAAVTSTDRTYDSSAGGTFAASVTVTDDGGLASVYYLWSTTDGTTPDESSTGWTAAGSFTAGDTSADVETSYPGITGDFVGELYIKASDTSGNTAVIGLGSYEYDLSDPDHELTYTEDITESASLTISGLPDDSMAVAMVKVPGSTDEYYVSILDAVGQENWPAQDIFDNAAYGGTYLNHFYAWEIYKVTNDNGQYTFTYLGEPTGDDELAYMINKLYYGAIEVTILTGRQSTATSSFSCSDTTQSEIDYGGSEDTFYFKGVLNNFNAYDWSITSAGTGNYPVFAETVTLKAAPYLSKVYSVGITTSDVLKNHVSYNDSYGTHIRFDPDDSSKYALSTLEGATFHITLANNKVPDWGIDDVDFGNTYLSVRRLYDKDGTYVNEQVGDRLYLSPQATQDITLPAGDYPTGEYDVVLTVTAKASGQQYTFSYYNNFNGFIFVDASPASQNFGFAGYSTYFSKSLYGISVSQANYYGPSYGAADADGNAYTQYTAGDGTVYIPVNGTVSSDSVMLYFTAGDVDACGNSNYPYSGVKAVKAWNVTDGVNTAESEADSAWYAAPDAADAASQNSYYLAKLVDSADGVLGAYGDAGSSRAYLPLIRNTLNTIAFQIVNANGKASEVRYVYIYPVDTPVSGTVSITNASGYVEEGKLTFTPADGQSMNNVSVYVYDFETNKLNDITASYDLGTNSYSLALTDSGTHSYFVYTEDAYGEYTLFDDDSGQTSDRHHWTCTDGGAPTVASSSCSDAGNGKFVATYTFNEDTIWNRRTQTLNVYFDSDYMSKLGYSGASNATYPGFTLSVPIGTGKSTIYSASESNPCGIYQVDAEPVLSSKQVTVTIYGAVKYDDSQDKGATVTQTLYATLEDPFGNISDPGSGVEFTVSNTKSAYTNGQYGSYTLYNKAHKAYLTNYGLAAAFNTPVMLSESIGTDSPSGYSETKTGELPILGDGTYDISFYDIFGTKWTQEITLDGIFGDYGLQISLSDTGYTSDAVTVTLGTQNSGTESFSVFKEDGNGNPEDVPPADGSSDMIRGASSSAFKASDNGTYDLAVWMNGVEHDMMFYITNIATGAPTAAVQWYYSEFKSNTPPDGVTSTTEAVTAWYAATRDVTPAKGTSASHTFYPGDADTSYTFEYADEAGNEGSVTATLPIGLKEPAEPVPDKTAPEYGINIYGMLDGVYYAEGYYSSTVSTNSLGDEIAQAGYVQSYYFDIDVTEDSAYKFVLLSVANTDTSGITYADCVSASVDGVTLSGRTLTVTKAAAFTVAIVDKSNNVSSFSMNIGAYFDNTAPTATAETVYSDFYHAKAYLSLGDKSDGGTDTGNNVTILSPIGLPVETDDQTGHSGQYYCAFTDNRSVTITFRDEAGNKGSTTITVGSIDADTPASTVKWSPYYYDSDSDTSGDVSTPPNHKTNKDVTATVSYSKSIGGITPSIAFYNDSTSQWGDFTLATEADNVYFTLQTTDDSAAVTFHKGNIAVQLVAAALNGNTVTDTLYLGNVIDTAAPTVVPIVNYNYNAGFETGTPYSATIILTPGEDVYCSDSPTPDALISQGDSISFIIHKKGDYTYHFTDAAGNTKTVTVSAGKDMDSTPPGISLDTGDGTVTSGNVTVSVSMDEDGTLAVTGANKTTIFSGTVSKNSAKQLTIANNGSYGVTACDVAGNKTTTAFVIGCIDNTSPSIAFAPMTVGIRQGSGSDALKALLDAGYTASDDKSARSNIAVTYDDSGVALNTVGVYSVIYTAVDEAGNTATATRFVKVYSRDELEVLLNDKKTDNGGTTTLVSKTITISMTNPAGDEPYTIYLRRGIKSEGQMKTGCTIITPDANGSFTVSSDGFYTLYIVTQSRQTYLTKIYIEQ